MTTYNDPVLIKEIYPYVKTLFENVNEWENLKVPVLDMLEDFKVDLKDTKNYCLLAKLAEPDLNNGDYIPHNNIGEEMEFYTIIRGANNNKAAEMAFFVGPILFRFLDESVDASGTATWRGIDISEKLSFDAWANMLVDIQFDDTLVRENIDKFNKSLQNAKV